MATTIERNTVKAMSDFSHKVHQLSTDVIQYVGEYRWNGKSPESAAGEWDNIQASMDEVKHSLHVLEANLELAHNAVNDRFGLPTATDTDDKNVIALD